MKRVISVTLLAVFVVALNFNYSFAKGEKVTLCHKPDTPAEKTIRVKSKAVQAHLAHGDYLGECSDSPPGPTCDSCCPTCDPCDSCCEACPPCDEPQVWLQSDQLVTHGFFGWWPLQDLYLAAPVPFVTLNVYYGPADPNFLDTGWYTITCVPENMNKTTGRQNLGDTYLIDADVSSCSILSDGDLSWPFALQFGAGSVFRIYETGTISFYQAP